MSKALNLETLEIGRAVEIQVPQRPFPQQNLAFARTALLRPSWLSTHFNNYVLFTSGDLEWWNILVDGIFCELMSFHCSGSELPELTISAAGLHKLWYPGIRDRSTWSKFGAHGEHGDVFLFSNLGAL